MTFVADPPAPPGWSASDIAALARAFDGFVAGDAERMARHGAAALDELAEPFDRWQLKLALRAFDLRLANLALGAGAVRYRDLEDAARDRYLLGWGTSRFSQRRTTFQALKRLALFLAYADPGSGPEANRRWAPMGYRPRWETPTTEPSPVEPLEVDRSGGAPGGVLDLEADIVIVGSGAGGGVVAARAAAAGRSVLVVEAGSAWPEATMPTDELTGFKRMFLARGLSANADLSVAILAGSTLGGGMTVNWTTSIDAPPAVREHWTRDHGLEGFDGPDTDADFARLRADLRVATAGSIAVKDRLLIEGCHALGYEAAPNERNTTGCDTCGGCTFGCRVGAKQAGVRGHLALAAGYGARFLVDAPVDRIVFEGRSGGRRPGSTARARRWRPAERGRPALPRSRPPGRDRGRRPADADRPPGQRSRPPLDGPRSAPPPGPCSGRHHARAGGDVDGSAAERSLAPLPRARTRGGRLPRLGSRALRHRVRAATPRPRGIGLSVVWPG